MTGQQILLATLIGLMVALVILAVFWRRRFVRLVFRPLLGTLYRKRVIGAENLPASTGCVVVCNHISWIDGILILWMLPRNVRFIVDGGNFPGKFMEWVAGAFDTILMHANPKSIGRALKEGRKAIANGEVVGLFPEGTITRTGQLQAFKPGLTKILKDETVPVIPLWLDGMWGSVFSFSGGKFFWKWPRQWRRTLTLYVGKPLPGNTPLELIRNQVQQLGAGADIDHRDRFPNVARRVIRVWRKAGGKLKAADSTGATASGREMLTRTLILRRILHREVLQDDEQNVGVLLPPSVGGVVVNVALAFDRRVSANLNYTVTSDVINHCTRELGIRHVLTSEKFLSKIDLELEAEPVLLDTLRDKVTLADKVIGFAAAVLAPAWLLDRMLGLNRVRPDDLLTVIFTSGSTGMPKGVMLTHANISHNVDAINRSIKLTDRDTILGILPFFHSFGYSVTLWGTMTLGPTGVYHFNPLDAKQVGKLAQRYQATVLLSTPTFLRSYLRRIEPAQFANLDVVVVGAEKMPADLFDAFEKRFGVRPTEGYGTTELSPLVSVNIPPSRSAAHFQADRIEGSVGRPVPGVSARVISPDDGTDLDANQDGLLLIKGPNVMRGYVNHEEKTREVLQDGWYSTGDIARIDSQGFIHITGRLSRFSKIGGEMVPHVVVEEHLARLLSQGEDDEELRVCVTAVPDKKKGERLIVLHTETEASPDEMRGGLQEAGLPNLFIPGRDSFFEVDAIPLLGTGKLDLRAAKDQASELVGN